MGPGARHRRRAVSRLRRPPAAVHRGHLATVERAPRRRGGGPVRGGPGNDARSGSRELSLRHLLQLHGRRRVHRSRPQSDSRGGWFDELVARYSVLLNQIECFALTLFDVLDEFDEIPICVAYEHGGKRIDLLPADPTVLNDCRPVYEILPGWRTPTSGARRFEDLPARARDYVRRLESLVGCEIGVISTSPQRDGTIVRPEGRIEHWLPVRQPVRAQA